MDVAQEAKENSFSLEASRRSESFKISAKGEVVYITVYFKTSRSSSSLSLGEVMVTLVEVILVIEICCVEEYPNGISEDRLSIQLQRSQVAAVVIPRNNAPNNSILANEENNFIQ